MSRGEASEPPKFPWKLAAAAVLVMAVVIGAGRAYLPGRSTRSDSSESTEASPTVPAPTATTSSTTGSILVETQPAGAKILLDGKAAGETPVTLEGVRAGRHVVTLLTSGGAVKRVVRVEAGKQTSLDVPVFSGWVAIYAPIVLEVAENGKTIGTTEQGSLMLSPGRHELTLSNRQLGYTSDQTIVIEPGEERAITVDPRGVLSLNAQPWAEIWIDGEKKGETPIANLRVPIGTREVIFKNPKYGERKLTTTVTAKSVTALSVDFLKPSN